jgi:hypothetical protein
MCYLQDIVSVEEAPVSLPEDVWRRRRVSFDSVAAVCLVADGEREGWSLHIGTLSRQTTTCTLEMTIKTYRVSLVLTHLKAMKVRPKLKKFLKIRRQVNASMAMLPRMVG